MLRPARVHAPALVLCALAAAFFGISRTSGSGWATVLVAVLVGTVVCGALLPAIALARQRLLIDTPSEGTVSVPLSLGLSARAGSTATIAELDDQSFRLGSGSLIVEPRHRGSYHQLTFAVRSSAPLGFVQWRRTIICALPVALDIGPWPTEAATDDLRMAGASGDEDVRGIRSYRPGDSPRLVHWAATARTGDLMVRETDGAKPAPIVIVVELRGSPEVVELTASQAAGRANAALRAGIEVVLITEELGGEITGSATTPADVGRRLACAIATPPFARSAST